MRRVYLALSCLLAAVSLTGCEAELDLSGVADEQSKTILRFDMFQALAATDQRIAAISSSGAVLVSEDQADTWVRYDLPEEPALIGLAACPSGDLFALDNLRNVWGLRADSTSWDRTSIDTFESVLSISCTAEDDLWVSASFGTTFVSHDGGGSWLEWSLNDDLQITTIDFVDASTGFAVGEFGTVLMSTDAGQNWERRADLPNEFYPMAADFIDASRGWVGGLDGVIWFTDDGGLTWQRGQSPGKAPIYGIAAREQTVVAVGEGGTLIQLKDDRWAVVANAPPLLAYLRGVCFLKNGDILVAGGAGTLLRIPVSGSANEIARL